jgi:hypothetical protein
MGSFFPVEGLLSGPATIAPEAVCWTLAMNVSSIEENALALPVQERAKLIERSPSSTARRAELCGCWPLHITGGIRITGRCGHDSSLVHRREPESARY